MKYKSYAYATKIFRGEKIGNNLEICSCYKVCFRIIICILSNLPIYYMLLFML